jgi:hypothetical protein
LKERKCREKLERMNELSEKVGPVLQWKEVAKLLLINK